MTTYADFHRAGVELVSAIPATETALRRGVSTLYYGLFHHLTAKAATVFLGGGTGLPAQVARAFNHQAMRKVCEEYNRAREQPFRPPLDLLHAVRPNERLFGVSDAFVRLQEARHGADYDLSVTFSRATALELLAIADGAHVVLDDIEGLPETRVFLTALLLADKWGRRG